MSHAIPGHLADFMKMRQGLHGNVHIARGKKEIPVKAIGDDMSVQMIIDKTPPIKDVAEWLQKKVDVLSKKKMDS